MISAPTLKFRTALGAAKRRLAASSVAPVYVSAFRYTHCCVISNANAYRLSPARGTIFSGGGLE